MPSNRARVATIFGALAVGALALASWMWWLAPTTSPDVAPRGPESPIPARADPAALEPSAARQPSGNADDGSAALRESAGAPSNATAGSLLVHVVWGDDKQPAADLQVRVWRPGADDLFERLQAATDAKGSVLFDGLAPGKVYPQLAPGRESEHTPVTIVAGQRVEVTLATKVGMSCKGLVVDDDDKPVADAEIVFAGWAGGSTEVLTHSAADGTFAMRGIDTHCHVGARKAGMRPSSLRQFTASEGSTVEFKIVLPRLGASIAGVLLDPDGKPVAGAIVRAGDREQNNHTLPDGASAMGPQVEIVRTDEQGRFEFASVVPGKVPVAARARGLAPWQDTIEVAAGRREELTIHLQPGVVLFGTVRDAAGVALEKVSVRAGDWNDLGVRSVRTTADGTFRIDGLAAGSLPVIAEHDTFGKFAETLQVVAGEQRRWDPVLSAGLQLRGRVLDPDDKPLAKVMVEAQLEQPSRDDHWFGFENTDDNGRFVLNNCKEGSPLRLTIKRKSVFPELLLNGVLPSNEELIVHLPKEAWVHLQGTVLGPDGEVLPNVHATPYKKDGMSGAPAETVDATTGAFKYGPYPPGTYTLRFAADGFPTIRVPERALAPDETWDVGTLHFERGGTLVVNPIAAGVAPKLQLSVYDGDVWLEHLQQRDGAWRSNPLPAGAHELHVRGENVASRVVPFEIRAGAEARLDVPIVPGAPAAIECVLPAGDHANHAIALIVRNGEQVVWRGNVWPRAREPNTRLQLAAGTYSVEASFDALFASGTLVVGGASTGTLKLELKPKPR